MNKELNSAQQTILNKVYQASSKILGEREHNGTLMGNSHHIAQNIQEKTRELLEPIFEGGLLLDKKEKTALVAILKGLLTTYESEAALDPGGLVQSVVELRGKLSKILGLSLSEDE